MKNKNTIVTSVIVAIVVGAIGFMGGMYYQKSQTRSTSYGQFGGMMNQLGRSQGQMQGGQRMFGNNRSGMTPVSGEVISVDDTSLTVKLQDGSSKIVILSEKTTINKTSEAAKADLKAGDTITAFGITNADGSVTAQNVAIGTMMFRMPARTGQQPQ